MSLLPPVDPLIAVQRAVQWQSSCAVLSSQWDSLQLKEKEEVLVENSVVSNLTTTLEAAEGTGGSTTNGKSKLEMSSRALMTLPSMYQHFPLSPKY